jgi:RNA polymerase sigma-70 factor (ECF subfamily)
MESQEQKMDESTLIAAAKSGDRETFNQLIVRYQSIAYNVAYRILGDVDAAADATQDAFLSAYRAIPRFRGGSFKAWLLRIVSNACYDQLRSKKRRPTTSLDANLDSDWGEWREDTAERPEAYVERQELGQILQRGLDALPLEQRSVVILSDIQGMHYNEIAETMGVSLGTVKSRLNRGRRKLRDFLRANAELLPARYRLHDKAGGAVHVMNVFVEWMIDQFVVQLIRRGANRYD